MHLLHDAEQEVLEFSRQLKYSKCGSAILHPPTPLSAAEPANAVRMPVARSKARHALSFKHALSAELEHSDSTDTCAFSSRKALQMILHLSVSFCHSKMSLAHKQPTQLLSIRARLHATNCKTTLALTGPKAKQGQRGHLQRLLPSASLLHRQTRLWQASQATA